LADERSTEVAAFWAAYVAATGATASYATWGFGDEARPDLMTSFGLLVRDGPKRATTARLDSYDERVIRIP
jgi:uncharacterized protein YhfF